MSTFDSSENSRPAAKSPWIALLYLAIGVGIGIGLMRVAAAPPQKPRVDANRAASSTSESADPPPVHRGPLDLTASALGAAAGVEQMGMTATDSAASPGDRPVVPPPIDLTGSLPAGSIGQGNTPLKPIVIEGDSTATPTTAYTELAAIVSEADVEAAVQTVRQRVRARGGRVELEFERDPDRPELGIELVIAIPQAQSAHLRDELSRDIAAREMDTWSGPLAERRHRMERFLREASEALTSKLDNLRSRYLDDAPEVIHTAETLERVESHRKRLRALPAQEDGLKVFVGRALSRWP